MASLAPFLSDMAYPPMTMGKLILPFGVLLLDRFYALPGKTQQWLSRNLLAIARLRTNLLCLLDLLQR